jgi:hypothetical protein
MTRQTEETGTIDKDLNLSSSIWSYFTTKVVQIQSHKHIQSLPSNEMQNFKLHLLSQPSLRGHALIFANLKFCRIGFHSIYIGTEYRQLFPELRNSGSENMSLRPFFSDFAPTAESGEFEQYSSSMSILGVVSDSNATRYSSLCIRLRYGANMNHF